MTAIHRAEARVGDVRVGDLIVAAYDEAAQYTTDPAEVSRLATRAVIYILERGRGVPHARKRPFSVVPGLRSSTTPLKLVPRDPPPLRLVPNGSRA
jgi:hypothetical protein